MVLIQIPFRDKIGVEIASHNGITSRTGRDMANPPRFYQHFVPHGTEISINKYTFRKTLWEMSDFSQSTQSNFAQSTQRHWLWRPSSR